MTSSVLMVIVFALLVYGVERNHRRQQRARPRGMHEMIGSTDVLDRDLERMTADLRALPEIAEPATVQAAEPPTIPSPRTATPACQRPVAH